MEVVTVVPKPHQHQALRFDGSFTASDFLTKWIKSSSTNQRITVVDEKRILLEGPEGTTDIFENYWFVRNRKGSFDVYDNDEFKEKFSVKVGPSVQQSQS